MFWGIKYRAMSRIYDEHERFLDSAAHTGARIMEQRRRLNNHQHHS